MLGSAIEADGYHTKAEGGIFNNVQAECLPADMVDHLLLHQCQNHPANTFLNFAKPDG